MKVTGKPAKINLKFFAYADKDHMPLRRVMIDWGDGNIAPREGYFRNHRGARPGKCLVTNKSMPDKKQCYGYPYESGDKNGNESGVMPPLDNGNTTRLLKDEPADGYTVPTNLSCWDDSDCKFVPQCVNPDASPFFSFILGKTCDSNYFYSEKIYGCQKGGPNYEANCAGGAYAAEFPEGCCKYIPKVQVLDNWGWCNGTCEPGGGCYNDGANMDCSPQEPDGWTSFGGKVYVKPL